MLVSAKGKRHYAAGSVRFGVPDKVVGERLVYADWTLAPHGAIFINERAVPRHLRSVVIDAVLSVVSQLPTEGRDAVLSMEVQ